MPTDLITDFNDTHAGAMEILLTTMQGLFPEDDDSVCTAIATLAACVITQQFRDHKRNVTPIIIDRLKQCFSGTMHPVHKGIPFTRMLEEAGLSGDTEAAERALLAAMMRGEPGDDH